MHKMLISLATLGTLLLLGACTSMNNCTGNGFENPEYCTETLHPNAGPYAFRNSDAE
jgi:hypothetical protein